MLDVDASIGRREAIHQRRRASNRRRVRNLSRGKLGEDLLAAAHAICGAHEEFIIQWLEMQEIHSLEQFGDVASVVGLHKEDFPRL